jgi:hypothetical protein
VCDLAAIDDIVTNKRLPDDIQSVADQSGVTVHLP